MKMIDISNKDVILRQAEVKGEVILTPKAIKALKEKRLPKGDALTCAKIAGILAAKRTAELIPLCHPLTINHVDIKFEVDKDRIRITCSVKAFARTGVEIEAFVATVISALTIYDMCKKIDPKAKIVNIQLVKKVKSSA